MNPLHLVPLFVAVPLGGAFLIALLGKRLKWVPDLLGNAVTLATASLAVWSMFIVRAQGTLYYSVGAWQPPVGIGLVLDSLSAFMLVTVNVVAWAVALFSIQYMEKFTAKFKFYALFLLMIAGMNGVIITGDIFNLFVFLEIAAVASYALVAFGTERHELEAAFKYAVMGTLGSLFLLLGIVFLYGYTSTLNMRDMAVLLQQKGAGNLIMMVSVFFIFGFGLKAALVPFHAWLPDAHPSAPAPISAMLSGVLIKSLGVYTLARIFFNVFGLNATVSTVLMVLGTISMVIGGLLAVGQWDFKRLLAYSSISQIGYIIVGIGLGTPLGIVGGLFHLFNHSVFKALLFLNSGAVEYATGTRDMTEMGGLAKKMPVTATTNVMGSMSVAGIPPFAGFWSKLLIIVALVEAGAYWYAFWAVLVSVLTLGMYVKILKNAFFGVLKQSVEQVKEVPILMQCSMIILAVICTVGGLLIAPNLSVFVEQASGVLVQGIQYVADIMAHMS